MRRSKTDTHGFRGKPIRVIIPFMLSLLVLAFMIEKKSSVRGVALNGSVVIETRPFAINPNNLFLQNPDGIFNVAMDDQLIGIYVKNTGPNMLQNVEATLSVAASSGITLTKASEHFGDLPPNVPVFGSYRGSFGSSSPGKYELTLNITANGFSGSATRQIFVADSSIDPVSDIISAVTPEGTILVDIQNIRPGPIRDLNTYAGADIDTDFAVTKEVMTMIPSSPFSGQFSEIPFQDPWWKVAGLVGKGLVGFASGYAIAEGVDEVCQGQKTGVVKVAGGVGSVCLAVSEAASLSDIKDPFRRGEESTFPLPTELTTKETVEVTATYTAPPKLGTPYSANVSWTFTRFTTGNTYQHSIDETVTNVHFSTSRNINTNKLLYSVGEDVVVTAQFLNGEGSPFKASDAYVFAGIDTDEDIDPEFTIFLTDDGHGGDSQAGDGVYSGTHSVQPTDPEGRWDVFVYAQDVNDAAENADPLVAAQTIGGLVISSPDCNSNCPITCTPDASINIGPVPPVDYSSQGIGKYLAPNGAVSLLRLNLSGTAFSSAPSTNSPNSFSDISDISSNLRVFNYATRALIESTSFSLVQGEISGSGDLRVNGAGKATVNGVPADINLSASKIGGVIQFNIRNAFTGEVLASGTGEPGRAALQLTIGS